MSAESVALTAARLGAGDGPPLVIAHGLFGSARNWGALSKALAEERRVIAVDMRNHGRSPRSADHSYAAMAEDLAAVIEAEGGEADLLGHSMGGKAAMALALTRPELVRRLVVVDIAPRAYDHAPSQERLIAAMRGLDLAAVTRRSEADAALEDAIPDRRVRAFLLQSLDVAERRWDLNLPVLADAMEAITGWPAPEGRFDGPALFLHGGASDYLAPEDVPEIRRLFPAARIEAIEGAGHWLHAERPRDVEAVVRAFLA